MLATFIVDRSGVALRDQIGVSNMSWSTDFPHHGNDWPYSRKVIDELFANVSEDQRKKIICDNAAPFSLIIPINSAVPFAIGTRVDVYQANFGQVTISSAATLRYPIGPKIKGIYGEVGLTKIGNDEWIISGYISA